MNNEKKETRKNSKKMSQVRSTRMMPCKVTLIDNEVFETSVDKRSVGQHLFTKVIEHLNLLEADYFGLSYYDSAGIKYWVNNTKKLSKQMKYGPMVFDFEVKFYSPDPSQLHEDLTRYQLCLQIRKDINTGRLPCSFVTYALLGSYTAQSELGDYDVDEHGTGTSYVEDIQFAPKQDNELLEKIVELHKTHKGQTPEEAEIHFLENAKKLAMYGMEIHQAKDAEGVDINLGVCANGLIVFKEKLAINRFVWPKILKISYRRNKFCIKIRPGEFESFQSMISFRLSRIKLAKRIWKICVEHHSFFRFRDPDMDHSFTFPRLGSKFRYSGRTQFQTKQLTAMVDRESPFFDRVHSKRATYHGRTTNRSLEREMYRRPPPKYDNVPSEEPADRISDSLDEDPYERKSKLEKMHAVPTLLTSVERDRYETENHTNGPPGYSREDPEKNMSSQAYEEPVEDERNYTTEQTPVSPKGILLSDKERKKKEKEEKEKLKREKEEEKKRMKEEAKRRKAEEKERKAAEKAKKKDKSKDWDKAVAVAVTAEGVEVEEDARHSDRLHSFRDEEHDNPPTDMEMPEERAIDVSLEPLSESTPIKGAPESTPDNEAPESETPVIEVPDIEVPDIEVPNIEAPVDETEDKGDEEQTETNIEVGELSM